MSGTYTGQDPAPSSRPTGWGETPQQPVPPQPMIPLPATAWETEQVYKQWRNELGERSKALDLQYVQMIAAQGQLQTFQQQQIAEATGNDVTVESQLLEAGFPMADLRQPDTRRAYGDWSADLESRMGQQAGGIPPEWLETKKKIAGQQRLVDVLGEDVPAMQGFVQERAAGMASPMQAVMNPLLRGASAATFGSGMSREQEMIDQIKRRLDLMSSERFGDEWERRGSRLRSGLQEIAPTMPSRDVSGVDRAAYEDALKREAVRAIENAVNKTPGLKAGAKEQFFGQVAEILGVLGPLGAAGKVGKAGATAVFGEGKSAATRLLISQGGGMAGMGALGASHISPDQKAHIESLPKEKQGAAEAAARIENAVDYGLFAPFWHLGGVLGGATERFLAKGFGKGVVTSAVGGAATGLSIHTAGSIAGATKDKIKDISLEQRDGLGKLIEAGIVTRPGLKSAIAKITDGVLQADWDQLKDGLRSYGEEALPSMAAFGALRLVTQARDSVMGRAFRENAQEVEVLVEELGAQARREAAEVLPPEQAKILVDKTLAEAKEMTKEAAPQQTSEGKLAEEAGLDLTTAKKQIGERVVTGTAETYEQAHERLIGEMRKEGQDPAVVDAARAERRALRFGKVAREAENEEILLGAEQRAGAERAFAKAMREWVKGGRKGPEPVRETETKITGEPIVREMVEGASEREAARGRIMESRKLEQAEQEQRIAERVREERVVKEAVMERLPIREIERVEAEERSGERMDVLSKVLHERRARSSSHPVEEKVIEKVAIEGKTSSAAAPLQRVLDLSTEKPALPQPVETVSTHLPPRAQELMPPRRDVEQVAKLKQAESAYAVLAGGKATRFLSELADKKTAVGQAMTQSVREWAELAMKPGSGHPTGSAEYRFLEHVRDNADAFSRYSGKRFTAELLHDFIKKDIGEPPSNTLDGTNLGQITTTLKTEFDAVKKLGKHDLEAWFEANSSYFRGAWSVAARYYEPARKLTDQVIAARREGGVSAEAGFVISPHEWLAGIGRLLWRFPQKAMADLAHQMEREPMTRVTLARRLTRHLGLEFPEWAGSVSRDGIASVARSAADMQAAMRDFFHTSTGKLREIKTDSQQDNTLWEMLNEGPQGAQWRVIAKRAKADEESRKLLLAAVAVRRWMQSIRRVIVAVHPKARILRSSIDHVDADVASAKAQIREWERKKVAAGDLTDRQDVFELNESLKTLHSRVRKVFGHLREAPPELKELANRLGREKAAIYEAEGLMLPVQVNAVLNGLKRDLKGLESRRGMLHSMLDEFTSGWGVGEYIRHLPELEMPQGGMWREIHKDSQVGTIKEQTRRATWSGITAERQNVLEEQGKVSRSAVRSVADYIARVVPYVRRSEFLNKIDKLLYGEMTTLGRAALRPQPYVYYGDVEARSLGTAVLRRTMETTEDGREVSRDVYVLKGRERSSEERAERAGELRTARMEHMARLASGQGSRRPGADEFVLLWTGRDPVNKENLSNPKWVKNHLQSEGNPGGGLIALPKDVATRQLRVLRGGWWERATNERRRDMVDYIQQVLHGVHDPLGLDALIKTGAEGAQRTVRFLTKWMTMGALGGDAHSAFNNVAAGTTLNLLFKGGNHSGTAIKEMGTFLKRYARADKTALGQDYEVKATQTNPRSDYQRITNRYDALYRTPPEELARMSDAEREQRVMRDDGLVALMSSGVLTGNAGDWAAMLHRWDARTQAPKSKIPRPGELNLKAAYRTAENAWMGAFNASEVLIKAPQFLDAYYTARKAGQSDSEAMARGYVAVHSTAMIFNRASRAKLWNNPWYNWIGSLAQWTAHHASRVTSLPASTQAGYYAYVVGLMAAGNALGQDVIDVFGTRLESMPLAGERITNMLQGLGVSTEADPQGKEFKGPFNTLDSLPLPLPLPSRFGPGVEALDHLQKALAHIWAGNGEQAGMEWNRAVSLIDPRQWAAVKRYEKAFETEDAGPGAFLYRSSATGKGSIVLRNRGMLEWAYQMLPGTQRYIADQWQASRKERAQRAYLVDKQRELSLRGQHWMEDRIAAEKSGDKLGLEASTAEIKDIAKMGKELGLPVDRQDLARWRQKALLEGGLDTRLRSVVQAPNKASKIEALTRLLQDQNYALSKERFGDLTKRLGGKNGFREWISDDDIDPRTKEQFWRALRTKLPVWGISTEKR